MFFVQLVQHTIMDTETQYNCTRGQKTGFKHIQTAFQVVQTFVQELYSCTTC